MKQSNLSWIFLLTSFVFLSAFFVFHTTVVRGVTTQSQSTHVVISEVQVASPSASTDEFVELYNPTNSDISLQDWRLTKKTPGGTEEDLISTVSGTIKSHGFFLIGSSNYTGTPSADLTYTTANTVAADNTILLYGSNASVVDKIGFGTASDKEATAAANPAAGKSVERKANSASTISSMTVGLDVLAGNAEDTDNNLNDFILRNTPQPQNSLSSLEPVDPTPTPTSSITPTVTPSDSPTPTLSETPTVTPTATSTPTNTPIPTATPTMTPVPTATPTLAITATPTVTPTVMPTLTITPTTTPIIFPSFRFVCTTHYRSFMVFNITISFPTISCRLER